MDINTAHWNKFYSVIDSFDSHSSFSAYVYSKYIESLNKDNICVKIGDFGCGNCRDSMFFAEKGNFVYAVDPSGVLKNNNNNIKLIKDDIEHVLTTNMLETLVDVVYMRWFLHAVPYAKGKNIIKESVNNLKMNGLICIEVRSINDDVLIGQSTYNKDNSYSTDHKRWLYNKEMLIILAKINNIDIIELYEDRNFSVTSESNPLLFRLIGKKKRTKYYERSSNYKLYKDIIPLMNRDTIESYNHMNIFNKIVSEYSISYVSVAGTIIGLNRHGGIIPWDNDIDVGFLEHEWEKLVALKDIFSKHGLDHKQTSINHIHLGLIDCFLLKEKNEFYVGEAGTYCAKSEYLTKCKQIFGYTYIYAPICSTQSLIKRYGKQWYTEGDVNDNYHYKNKSVPRFILNSRDRVYQIDIRKL